MNVSIIIPNYNGKKLLEKNLPQLIERAGKVEIIIVDDGSADDSVTFLEKKYPSIKLIQIIKNQGFSTAVNLGVKVATGEIVLLLNTDIIPKKDFLKPLIAHFVNEKVFAVACKDNSIESDAVVERGRGIGYFHKGFVLHKKGETNKPNTFWASGGSSAFRKSLWLKWGGMDEIYNPFYWEDIDLSYRAQKNGYLILFESQSVVEHHHKEGSIKSQYTTAQIRTISYRNQWIFVWKNISDLSFIISHVVNVPVHLLQAVLTNNWSFIKGFLKAVCLLGKIMKKRQTQKKWYIRNDLEIFQAFKNE